MTKARKIAIWAISAVVGLVVLYFLFEWAGDLLDSGGVVGY
ncbi:MAG TPA: hypothetical protein VJ935_11960 [Acidimicrobiia bacterium]|nr:hypothetical protein [Acidimicrobiia bacterium]